MAPIESPPPAETSKAPTRPQEKPEWFIVADIARATGCYKKKIQRIAQREKWPMRRVANRIEYQPPRRIAQALVGAPGLPDRAAAPQVRFADLVGGDEQRELVLWREEAVKLLQSNLHLGKEMALTLVVRHFKGAKPLFRISETSLRTWSNRFAKFGLDGLVEQKRGAVGRKPFAGMLEPDHLLRAAAGAVEAGVKGRLNIARSYRDNLVLAPTLNGQARAWCHGDNASKSYVPPSVRDAIRDLAAPTTTRLLQIGPKAMRLDGAYSECSYEDLKPGQVFTADDMTANVYVWVEWPCADGFLLIRPQLLAVMDVGSMAWLNIRAVMRPKGQYNKDDVWGLIGDTLDTYGLFETAILEGGTWQSDSVIGQKTSLTDKERFGGLESIGIRVVHTRTPHGKIIETAFNQLQYAADNCRGFCGRMEMKDCPEEVKRQLAEVRAGKAHPRQYFLHLSEFTAHIEGVMKALNNERNDGKILRGQTPWDAWNAELGNAQRTAIPDSAKWLYRSTYSVVKVTRNGVRVTLGTGRNQFAYSYSAPEQLDPQRGRRVIAYWNDHDPDTDAVIYTVREGKPHQFLCVAKRVAEIPRLGASGEQAAIEATRKKLHANMAVTQSRTLAPFLQRGKAEKQKAEGQDDGEIKARLDAARAAAQAKRDQAARVRSEVRSAEVTAEDFSAATDRMAAPAETTAEMSPEEISALFSTEEQNPF